jgi:phenylalanyl-tRNA synthetase beta chain
VLEETSHPTFFPGRQARIVLKGLEIGTMGIIHPEVLDNFDLMYPVSAFEIDIQKIYSLI